MSSQKSITRTETNLWYPTREITIDKEHINYFFAEYSNKNKVTKLLINVWLNEMPYNTIRDKGIDYVIDVPRTAELVNGELEKLFDVQLITA